ncbi:B-cell CLL/lymphoma 6 member B protein-like [Atheta coriaria]|uniref:B-cell CLL/lymphoma 6 member B protein-like n=1 Tax=Dalotia coriaria TaxID=877792 RepID=UPI0031F35D9A
MNNCASGECDRRCRSNGSADNEGEDADEEGGWRGPPAEQRYLLRWHRHAPTITDHLPAIYEKGLFADVTLAVDGQSLQAHRLILASCSSYFLQIFQEADRNNIEHPYVVLLNAHLDDIRAILNFIYKGECCVYKHRIPEFLATAKSLRVSGLSDMQLDDYHILQDKPENKSPSVGLEVNRRIPQTLILPPPSTPAPPPIENQTPAAPPPPPTGKWHNSRDVPETCKCFVCGKYLSNQYNLRVHMETHVETYHACGSCPHVSRSRDALRKHMSYRHPDQYNARKHKRNNNNNNANNNL